MLESQTDRRVEKKVSATLEELDFALTAQLVVARAHSLTGRVACVLDFASDHGCLRAVSR